MRQQEWDVVYKNVNEQKRVLVNVPLPKFRHNVDVRRNWPLSLLLLGFHQEPDGGMSEIIITGIANH